MNTIRLKPFQESAIEAIMNQFESVNGSQKMIVKAPTGSGKTITLIGLVERLIADYHGKYVFCWLTPGKGDLEEQSKDKMDRFASQLRNGNLFDILTNGFSADTTYFINWETITKKDNVAVRESEHKNLFARIAEAHQSGLRFIVLIDEEHQNKTDKTRSIINAMNPVREIRLSATPEMVRGVDSYIIPEETVIAEQLITKALYINKDFKSTSMFSESNERDILIDAADVMRKDILAAYKDEGEDVNPLVLIQFPSLSDAMIESVEKKLESMGYTYDNGMVASWFSPENRADKAMNSSKIGKHNVGEIDAPDSITRHNAKPCFLLFKQALATGWDCPRAKILVKLRDNMNETFEIQTLGRLRRMPKARHYGNDLLDCAYLYTFDEKYKEAVIKDGSGFEVRRVQLKPEAKAIKVYKEVINRDINLVDVKKARKAVYEFFMAKYGLDPLTGDRSTLQSNIERLKAHGYIFGTRLHREFLVGRYRTLNEVVNAHDMEEVTFEVNTHSHGFLLRHEVGKFSNILSLSHRNMGTILKTLFLVRFSNMLIYKLIELPLREYYAFIINNKERLKEAFMEFESTDNGITPKGVQNTLFDEIKSVEATILGDEVYPFVPETSPINFFKNVYDGYDSSMVEYNRFRSTPEILFEKFCEHDPHVKFVYKNGDKGINYVSLIYLSKLGKTKNFYPDYIVQMENGDIWIIETKGGETTSGQDKNIDIESSHKLATLERYANQHSFKFGFVRDKNSSLYINRTGEWVDDMTDTRWERLEKVFEE